MKLTLRIIGTIAVVLLGIGVILYILMQWGTLVEYHAFEWRGIVTAKSPLVRNTSSRPKSSSDENSLKALTPLR